jgi:hypothetical protein
MQRRDDDKPIKFRCLSSASVHLESKRLLVLHLQLLQSILMLHLQLLQSTLLLALKLL